MPKSEKKHGGSPSFEAENTRISPRSRTSEKPDFTQEIEETVFEARYPRNQAEIK